MIWKRDKYLAYLVDFEDVGRTMFSELFGPLKQLEGEWRAAGATEEQISIDAFGFDGVDYAWIPLQTGMIKAEERIIEQTDEYIMKIDGYGRRNKLMYKSASLGLPLEFPVATPEDWEKIKPRYEFKEDRVDIAALKALKKRKDEGTLITIGAPGGYDELRELMGEVNLCYALYDEPEMIEDMLDTFARTALRALEIAGNLCPVDMVSIHEDMAGRSGPLVGPNIIRSMIGPYYKRVIDAAKAQGARLFSQDSDGNIGPDLEAFVEFGLNSTYPCEPQAGMDIVELRKQFGKRLSFKGGIDKFVLLKGPEAIREELERKLVPSIIHGGCVLGIDHRIPNGVTLENYTYYVKTAREMLDLEPIHFEKHIRMAF